MGRSVVLLLTFLSLVALLILTGCSSSATNATGFRTPANISLAPGNNVSLDVGTTQGFTATARDASNPPMTLFVPIAFHSSNTAVVTVANNGLACAGTWNSLILPQICTPGQFGVAEITATSGGISSPPTTVYVHQHVDNVTISPVTPPTGSCVSRAQTLDYQATAFSRGVDITSTVGQFTWTATNLQVMSVSNTVSGLTLSQARATANIPGMTQIFASIAGVNSIPATFITCPVNSISLAISDGTLDSFTVAKGASGKTVVPTVIDSAGTTITSVPLTWTSSQPAVAPVSTSGGLTFPTAGGATIVASCTPPTCNIGFMPSLPIYSSNPVLATVTETGTPAARTVLVSSKDCGTFDGCTSLIAPISSPSNIVGIATGLPATPNSLLIGPQVTNARAYLGTDLSLNGTRGLMAFDPAATAGSSVPFFPNQIGEVLAISPNANKVILSDRISSPNQVFVFDVLSGGSGHFAIAGATAADFSADSFKAFIAAGNTIYLYSTLDALQTIPLSYTATRVSSLSDGAFTYVLGSSPATVAAYRTCDGSLADSFSPSGNPVLMKTAPDGSKVLLLSSPATGIDIFDVTTAANPSNGCLPSVTHGPVSSFSLAQGNFVPTQLIVSSDSSRAYILTSNLPSILVFDLGNLAPGTPIALTGSAVPIQAALTLDGAKLYVAASDGTVHVLDTASGLDIQQLTFPVNPVTLQSGLCAGLTTGVSITAAVQVGANTTYTYTLTSGPALKVGASIVVTNMADAGNNGTFTIAGLGAGTFTVVNPAGVNATSQNGTGTVTVVCDPELIAVTP